MPPVTVVGLLVLLALVPGWLYLRLVNAVRAPSAQSGPLHQTLEVVAVGAMTTGISAFVLLLVPHRVLPFVLDVDAWAVGGSSHIREHPRELAYTVVVVLALALLIAYFLYRLRRPSEFRNYGNVWVHSIGERPIDRVPYIGLQLYDGRLAEGPLHSYTLEDDDGGRDIALARPIRITERDGSGPRPLPHVDRLVVPGKQIAYITVIHVPAAPTHTDGWIRRAVERVCGSHRGGSGGGEAGTRPASSNDQNLWMVFGGVT
jgi:hypothetical protein